MAHVLVEFPGIYSPVFLLVLPSRSFHWCRYSFITSSSLYSLHLILETIVRMCSFQAFFEWVSTSCIPHLLRMFYDTHLVFLHASSVRNFQFPPYCNFMYILIIFLVLFIFPAWLIRCTGAFTWLVRHQLFPPRFKPTSNRRSRSVEIWVWYNLPWVRYKSSRRLGAGA